MPVEKAVLASARFKVSMKRNFVQHFVDSIVKNNSNQNITWIEVLQLCFLSRYLTLIDMQITQAVTSYSII